MCERLTSPSLSRHQLNHTHTQTERSAGRKNGHCGYGNASQPSDHCHCQNGLTVHSSRSYAALCRPASTLTHTHNGTRWPILHFTLHSNSTRPRIIYRYLYNMRIHGMPYCSTFGISLSRWSVYTLRYKWSHIRYMLSRERFKITCHFTFSYCCHLEKV